uniref:DNA polymerase kappa n=1 Tax=Petromyzon marinus TaxID=7757 RepID=A0AAJ7X856_PETMA|nr:DNA polymerase kappa isoform X2 [Petromyzon marinus]
MSSRCGVLVNIASGEDKGARGGVAGQPTPLVCGAGLRRCYSLTALAPNSVKVIRGILVFCIYSILYIIPLSIYCWLECLSAPRPSWVLFDHTSPRRLETEDGMEGARGAVAAPGLVSCMALNDNKAGMEGLDKERINKVILDISKGSRFYENELKKEQQVNQKIERMLQQKGQLTDQQIRQAELQSTSNYHARRFGVRAAMPGFIAKKLCPDLVICPLNFNKYSAVSKQVREVLADYDPNFLPMSLDEAYLDITAHLAERQAWPESRRTFAAHEGLCQGRDCNGCRVAQTSSAVHNARDTNSLRVLGNGGTAESTCDPNVSPAGGFTTNKQTDEANDGASFESYSPELFDSTPPQVGGSENAASGFGASASRNGTPERSSTAVVFGLSVEEAVREMRFRIEQKTGLTASAGIAPNMLLAKVGSDMNKPNGQYRLEPTRDAIRNFVDELPIRKVSGIGKVTEKMLNALDVFTCAHLHRQRALVALLFSEGSCQHFLRISMGLGSTHVDRDGERKSMSTERTFSEINKQEELYNLCWELCGDLANDLSKEGLKGRTVTVKTKSVSFEVKTRAMSLPGPVASREEIYAAAKELLKTEMDNISPQPLRLRLMGVRLSGFVDRTEQKQKQRSISTFVQSTRSSSSRREVASPHIDVLPHGSTFGEPSTHPLSEQSALGSATGAVLPGQVEEESGRPEVRIKSFFQRVQAERQSQLDKQPSPMAPGPTLESAGRCASATRQPSPVLTANRGVDGRGGGGRPTRRGKGTVPVYTCPVCDMRQDSRSLSEFNAHIDECLGETEHSGFAVVGGSSGGAEWGHGLGGKDRPTRNVSLAQDDGGEPRQRACAAASGAEQNLHRGVERRAKQTTCKTNRPPCHSEESGQACAAKDAADPKGSESKRIQLRDFNNAAVQLVDALGECAVPRYRQGVGGPLAEHAGDREAACAPSGTMRVPAMAGAPTCPICLCPQGSSDLVAFNSHVDVCLNRRVIEELVGHGPGSTEAGKQPSISNGRLKRSHVGSKKSSAKRAKHSPSKPGIERFFQTS